MLSGAGRAFTAGLDLMASASLLECVYSPVSHRHNAYALACGYASSHHRTVRARHCACVHSNETSDTGRVAWRIRREVMRLQRSVTSPELCPQPVIAAVHGACIGGGIDLITACDIRVCSSDAFFTIKVWPCDASYVVKGFIQPTSSRHRCPAD